MTRKEYEGYKYVEGGVCAARGFVANGLNCGINPEKTKNDLGLVYSEKPCATAAVYTQNKVKGAPIFVTQRNLEKSGGISRAVIVNSKNANTCNANGEEVAEAVCELVAEELQIKPEEVIVASTGVIGEPLSVEPFASSMKTLVEGLSVEGHDAVTKAIMTTDTVQKEVAVEFELDGKVCRLGGMAKGSGMIHPNMATTLNFITTDVAISSELLQKALSETVKTTYNCLSVDGDTSTNDMVSVMANGEAGNPPIATDNEAFHTFQKALYIVMKNMTMMLAADGEGASKFLECSCDGAPNQEAAITVAKSVIRSPLVKCAMYGEDANCGRIFCAIGYAEADFDINKVEVELSSSAGKILVFRNGFGVPFSEDEAAEILKEKEIYIHVHLNQGDGHAKAWGCDFTYDYVKINGDYRS
ncbi:MAG: bifunctional glutamate N-acetyltransferase/amino-acid acetyltransferase ArgJ [Lachnospiraceae bacterium]|nr:bifunctional glutamate N-acetyltransferase/amino-acid acetyltransferase ArgJ [Lachnospiraceae bacterium]